MVTSFPLTGLHLYSMIGLHGSGADVFTGGSGILPRFMTYSSYSPEENIAYTSLVVLGFAFMFCTSLMKLIEDDK